MHVEITLKKRRTAKNALETGSGAGTDDMKAEYIVDDSDPVTSSALSI